jgi:rifampicin phosphotransferase
MKEKIYDNSNIAESYAGATTPLTFSFVRYIYQEVYQHFSEMMGVKKDLITENKQTFEHMVEFIGCRIYYNLNSWYKMLSFFPGYRFSSEFMEKMMGVDKHNPIKEDISHDFYRKYFFYLPKTIFQAIKISLTFLFLGWNMQKFNKYFDRTFSEINSIDLKKLNLSELEKSYRELADKLLTQWKVPIANDFAVMASAGLADRLFKKWLGSDEAYLNMRPAASKPLISLDPGNRVLKIVNFIKEDNKIYELFSGRYTEEEIMESLRGKYENHQVANEIEAYLGEFGTRMPNELKLESETLIENPNNFIALIKAIIQSELTQEKKLKAQPRKRYYRNAGLLKKVFLNWLLKWAGNSIRRREEARFRRALIFGHVRKIFLAIGEKFQQKQFIKNTRDVFYLTIEEIFNFINSGGENLGLLDIIVQRKEKFKKWQNIELPRRFETTKSIREIEQELLGQSVPHKEKKENQLMGYVASRPNGLQTFSGLALTIKDFDPTVNFEGKILVTCQTDPGWTIIFPLLKGVVVERGGMLSHAAIVARELNIPCIVGVEQATKFIPNGTKIMLDLQNGLINKVC